jgi:hypothetical protein
MTPFNRPPVRARLPSQFVENENRSSPLSSAHISTNDRRGRETGATAEWSEAERAERPPEFDRRPAAVISDCSRSRRRDRRLARWQRPRWILRRAGEGSRRQTMATGVLPTRSARHAPNRSTLSRNTLPDNRQQELPLARYALQSGATLSEDVRATRSGYSGISLARRLFRTSAANGERAADAWNSRLPSRALSLSTDHSLSVIPIHDEHPGDLRTVNGVSRNNSKKSAAPVQIVIWADVYGQPLASDMSTRCVLRQYEQQQEMRHSSPPPQQTDCAALAAEMPTASN